MNKNKGVSHRSKDKKWMCHENYKYINKKDYLANCPKIDKARINDQILMVSYYSMEDKFVSLISGRTDSHMHEEKLDTRYINNTYQYWTIYISIVYTSFIIIHHFHNQFPKDKEKIFHFYNIKHTRHIYINCV